MNYLECAKTAIYDLKISATDDQVEQLAQYFEQDVENSHDIDNIKFEPDKKSKCRCDHYKSEIERLEKIVKIYNNSVKERRNCDDVWVDIHTEKVHYN